MIMKTNNENVTGLQVSVESNFSDRCVASCRRLLAQLQDVREQVEAEFRDRLEEHQHVLDLAINEAEALAWQTGFPQLFFPTLATEKASAVSGWHLRQQSLRERTSARLIAA
jgi:hypothetical protein